MGWPRRQVKLAGEGSWVAITAPSGRGKSQGTSVRSRIVAKAPAAPLSDAVTDEECGRCRVFPRTGSGGDLSHVKAKASKLEQSSARPAAVRARKPSETRS